MRRENVLQLGFKELRSFARDPILIVLVAYTFTVGVYTHATAVSDTLHNAPIAVVDEDRSPLSERIIAAFFPPYFQMAAVVPPEEADRGMDTGRYTFMLNIPPDFQRDVLANRSPVVQLAIDATQMSQALTGSSYIHSIVNGEIDTFVKRNRGAAGAQLPVSLEYRARFNPELRKSWFLGIVQLINSITMLSVILTGAALIREREHGTIEHLLVMPVTPAEIMVSKIWSMGIVVLGAAALSLLFIVQGLLAIPIEGSVALFLAGAALHLCATTSMGMFLATIARSMPQFALLLMLTIVPLQLLSGGTTPYESMPKFVQAIMYAAPNTHFVMLGQGILFRGAGLGVIWPNFLALAVIATVLFWVSLRRFRSTIGTMA
jgi:ABC-2 type transport system permease protein